MNQSKPIRWVIGSRPDCDIVVDEPTVSGRHCQIQFEDGQWQVSDLDSTNGTWVDSVRIEAVRDISRGAPIRLGQTVYLDWNQVPSTEPEITIGRSNDNDVVFQDSSISAKHARIRCTSEGLVLEDLGSTNGTFIGTTHWNEKVDKKPISLSDRVRFGDHEIGIDKLLRRAAADKADVAIWLSQNPQTAPPMWVPGKRVIIVATLAVFAVVGLIVISNYLARDSVETAQNKTAKTETEDGNPSAAKTAKKSAPVLSNDAETAPATAENSTMEEAGTEAKAKVSAAVGSKDGIYSVVVRTLSDGLAFQVGSAWALDDGWLVTSAEVVHAAEQAEEGAEMEVYWGDGEQLTIEKVVVHPQYEAAEKIADRSFASYQTLLKKQSEKTTALPETEFESQMGALNKTFRDAVSQMAYFDVAMLRVKLPQEAQLRHPLKISRTPVNRIKGRDMKVLGHAHEMSDQVEFDPDTIQATSISGEILTSTQWGPETPAGKNNSVYLVHVECPASELKKLRSNNWIGSPVMDKKGDVVGVFSRLVVPAGAGDSEQQESVTEQERSIFLLAILDRLNEFPEWSSQAAEPSN